MCEHKPCGQGKPLPGPAIVAEPQGDLVSKGQAVCTRMGRKLQGLGLSGTASALSLGMNSPHSHLSLPFLSAEGERALWLNWLPLLFFTLLPLLLLWKGSSMGLSPCFIRASLQSLSLTHMPRIFSGELPSNDFHLMHKHVQIPGRQLLSQADVSKC